MLLQNYKMVEEGGDETPGGEGSTPPTQQINQGSFTFQEKNMKFKRGGIWIK